jgi:ATP-dependent Zn protease
LEVEKFYKKAKEILALNVEFLEKVAQALAAKKLLTSADIQEIKHSCNIVSVAL